MYQCARGPLKTQPFKRRSWPIDTGHLGPPMSAAIRNSEASKPSNAPPDWPHCSVGAFQSHLVWTTPGAKDSQRVWRRPPRRGVHHGGGSGAATATTTATPAPVPASQPPLFSPAASAVRRALGAAAAAAPSTPPQVPPPPQRALSSRPIPLTFQRNAPRPVHADGLRAH